MALRSEVPFPARCLREGKKIMPTYRAYLINRDDRVTSYRPIEAATDEEALEIAKQFLHGHDVEVWLLDRKVGRLEQ
jgi:hypothetical protein